MKFQTKLGKNATETYLLLKEVYGNECLSRACFFKWFKRFQDGGEDVEDDTCPGCPSTPKMDKNIVNIGNLTRSDSPLTTREITETVGDRKSVV